MNRIHKIVILLLITGITITACKGKKEEAKTEVATVEKVTDEVTLSGSQYKVADVETGKVEMRNLSSVVKANGMLDVPPQNVVSISAPLGGYVKTSGLLPGQVIQKGQMLASI